MLQNKWDHSIENKNIENGRALEAAFKNEIIVKYLALQKDKQSTQHGKIHKRKYVNPVLTVPLMPKIIPQTHGIIHQALNVQHKPFSTLQRVGPALLPKNWKSY